MPCPTSRCDLPGIWQICAQQPVPQPTLLEIKIDGLFGMKHQALAEMDSSHGFQLWGLQGILTYSIQTL